MISQRRAKASHNSTGQPKKEFLTRHASGLLSHPSSRRREGD
jgi:hypothetical protein